MPQNPQARLSMVLFLLNEAEIEIGKLTAPQLTLRARQIIVESASKKILGTKIEINEIIKELGETTEKQPIGGNKPQKKKLSTPKSKEGEDVIIEGDED